MRPAILFGNFLIIDISIAKCLEKTCHEIIEPKLNDTQCRLRPGHSTTDQIFTLQQIFEIPWEYAKDVYTCFVDLEKAYHRVTREKLSGVFRENGVDDRLLLAIKSLYPAQKFLSLSEELNQNCSPLVSYCGKQGRIQWRSDRSP